MNEPSPIPPLVLHEDAFYAFFSPYRHPESRFYIWGGYGLETFGEDLQLVRRLDDSYVWTVLMAAATQISGSLLEFIM